ncbi:MAG: DUF2752 domain-containing protein [Phycisphaerales bacterium]
MSEQKKSKWFANTSLPIKRPGKSYLYSTSTREDRIIFLAIFLGIVFLFSMGFLIKSRVFKFGISDGCSFYRYTGIPCPTCYWTRAFESFVKFGTTEALKVQPAATICYIILVFVAFFSLLSAILGVNFVFLPSIRLWRIDLIAIAGVLIVLIGWAITIIRVKSLK